MTSPLPKKWLITAGSLAACYLFVWPAARSCGRHTALREVEREAITQHAPDGLLGAKWLMSKSEVLAAVRGGKDAGNDPAGNDVVVALGTPFGREALVSFHINKGHLLIIVATFQDPSSQASFEVTQRRLVSEFGAMPAPSPYDGSLLTSKKVIDRFAVYHELKEIAGAMKEQVVLYRTQER